MSTHGARVEWALREGDDFGQRRYSRVHTLAFDGGAKVQGSPSPSVVPQPFSDPAGVDPEEMFIGSIAACHMLWFLDLAARAGLTVTRYADQAEGVMERIERGRFALTRVTLRPAVAFSGVRPDAEQVAKLHEEAHEACFIANSIRTEISVEPGTSTTD